MLTFLVSSASRDVLLTVYFLLDEGDAFDDGEEEHGEEGKKENTSLAVLYL